jgi:hypothetical protein
MADIDIKKHVGAQVQQPSDLDEKGVHMVAAEDGKLHVLLKETKDEPAIDKLEGEIETKKGTFKVGIARSEDTLDLGKMGKWRIFEIEGIGDKTPLGPNDAPNVLHIFSAAAEGREAGSAFYASIDLAYAIGHVLKRDDIVVRGLPIADGEVAIQPALARAILERIGVEVDDRATSDVVGRLVGDFMHYRQMVADTGVIGIANCLGLIPTGPRLPVVDVYTGSRGADAERAKEGELSARAKADLEKLDLLPEGRITPSWAERTIKALVELGPAAPEALIAELRVLRRDLVKKNASATASAWGDEPASVETGPEKTLPVLNTGKFNKALAMRLEQLRVGLAGLGVTDEMMMQIAHQIVAATINPKETGFIYLAGEPYSAMDHVEELVLQAIGGPRVLATRADIVDKGAPGVYGLTPRGDAILSGAELKRARDQAFGHKVAIVFNNFEAAGTGEPDAELQAKARGTLLLDLAQAATDGFANIFSLADKGMKPASLKSAVVVVRDARSPREVNAELGTQPALKAIATKLIGIDRPSPEAAIARLLKDLGDVLASSGFGGAEIRIERDLRQALVDALMQLRTADAPTYAAAMKRFLTDLGDALAEEASQKEGAKAFVLGFSDLLINDDERASAIRGEAVPGALQNFAANAE